MQDASGHFTAYKLRGVHTSSETSETSVTRSIQNSVSATLMASCGFLDTISNSLWISFFVLPATLYNVLATTTCLISFIFSPRRRIEVLNGAHSDNSNNSQSQRERLSCIPRLVSVYRIAAHGMQRAFLV